MMQPRSYESEVFIAFSHPAQSLVTATQDEIVLDERSPELAFVMSTIDLSRVDNG